MIEEVDSCYTGKKEPSLKPKLICPYSLESMTIELRPSSSSMVDRGKSNLNWFKSVKSTSTLWSTGVVEKMGENAIYSSKNYSCSVVNDCCYTFTLTGMINF